jgi:hypothetical protein
MPREKDPECRGVLIGETEKAIRVAAPSGQSWWLPRSLIGYMRKERDADVTRVVFTFPERMIEEKQCWDLIP